MSHSNEEDGQMNYNLAINYFMPTPSTTRPYAPREQRPSGLLHNA